MTAPSDRGAACPVCEIHAESTFKVDGMDCREEVVILERRLKPLAGLEDIAADLIGQRLRVKYDAARLSASAIIDAVATTGMRAWLEREEPITPLVTGGGTRQTLLAISGALILLGLLASWSGSSWLMVAAFLGAIVTGGVFPAQRAWVAVRHRSLDINVLMLVAVAGGIAIAQWFESATVVFLFGLAQLLETWSMDRARRAIRALMQLAPAQARVRRRDGDHLLPVEDVHPGDTVLVSPGEKIPFDGTVLAGDSLVNQAPITGESMPVEKRTGDEVFAGTINGRGALDLRVDRLSGDSTLARIISLVEQAQAQRAPAQTLVERFAKYYTPAVIVLAILLATVAPIALHQPWTGWFYRSLVLLVIACPCALVISTPVSIVSALAGAARKGVLIKGGRHLERAGAVRCVAFDKTGTLTSGAPEVVDVRPLGDVPEDEVLRVAASLETRSEHPIGRAIVHHASALGVSFTPVDAFQARPGRGAEGRIGADLAVVGNHRLFEEQGLCTPEVHRQLDRLAPSGSAVLVAFRGATIGIIGLADRVHPSGRDALDLLRQNGIDRIVLLTGDSEAPARALGVRLGVDEVHAELLPEDKVRAVEELRRVYGVVAMVGDGVNDAPALAAADVGIAMGAAGSDAALETADVALMADDLLKIPYMLRLSRSTLANIRTNIGISIGLKAVFLALAVVGSATLWMAILADTGASLIVIANGLRLLRAD